MQGKIIAAVNYKGYILVFTEHGYVYKVWEDPTSLQLIMELALRMVEQRK